MTPCILLIGPTAVGKSRIAQALAQRFDGEIVSADSAQVYRGMDIGTAKPDAAARAAIPHHLVDVIDPTGAYSAARFRADAAEAIEAIRDRGRLPIVVGGTMLYVKALREGLSALPSANHAIRAAIDARAAHVGWPAMHDDLARIDAEAARRLAPTDAQRIQRALEVHALTGRPLSALQGARDAHRTIDPTIVIALAPADRARLHAAIARRFDAMLDAGLVDEVRGLRARFALRPDTPSMRAVGYRQAFAYLDGRIDRAELRERGIAATRQLAKRQITWLRAMNVETIDCYASDIGASVTARVAHAIGGDDAAARVSS
ncbi:MAG TPA: tRNA (adenosine(37)-N6)-dimethylallyltransferase MiaA [Casimicrobiaceae bacterium]|nr:tRNA (adenosine(37)-N6)-dimethylallyltransferase MiaA [Casimicrobiaceae bacterium]